jgi:AcrR family transcriptional regulator
VKRRSSQQVRRLVLDASAAAFRTRGLARVTTDEIAEAAGVSMSVIFRHFPSKGHLFREALVAPFVESMQLFTAAWKRSLAAPIDEGHLMRELVADLYDSLRAHDAAVAGLLTAEELLDPATTEQIQQLFNEIFAQLRDMGEQEAERRGWFSGNEMELNARLLVAMVTSVVAYRRWFLPAGRNRISRERIITHIANLMLYGLRLSPSSEAHGAVTAPPRLPDA